MFNEFTESSIIWIASTVFSTSLFEVLFVIIVSLIISFISTLLPAYRATRIDPIKTIKNE